jgi:hypothetical protein
MIHLQSVTKFGLKDGCGRRERRERLCQVASGSVGKMTRARLLLRQCTWKSRPVLDCLRIDKPKSSLISPVLLAF